MFVDLDAWPPPRRDPPPRTPRPSKRAEAVILWVVAVNLVLWFLSPIAGITLFHAMAALKG